MTKKAPAQPPGEKKQQLAGLRKAPRKPDNPAQYKRFLEAAREAEADETKEGADQAFKKIVSKKPPPNPR
jgi:hypothetical protein